MCAPAPTAAQTAQRPMQSGAPAAWLPRGISEATPVAGDDRSLYLTAAEKATVFARLASIERLFAKIPELVQPKGFEVEPVFVIDHQIGEREVVAYQFHLLIFVPTRKGSGGDATTAISVLINFRPPALFLDGQARWGPKIAGGRETYMEEWRAAPFPGATLVYGHITQDKEQVVSNASGTTNIVFTPGGVSPWLPVTREEFYRGMIAGMEGENGEKLAQMRKEFAKTPYQEWLAAAPSRAKERAEMLATIEHFQGKDAAAKARKTLEDSDSKVEAQLKADEARDRAANQTRLQGFESAINRVQAALDSMSVTERKLAAIIGDVGGVTGATGYAMMAAEGEYTHRVVTPNPDFLRIRKSRVEVRGVLVRFSSSDDPNVRDAVWQAYKKLDWDAIRALVAQ